MKRTLLLSVLFLACSSPPGNRIPPEAAAKKFVATLQLEVQGDPICTQIDSDRDGYVSCTVALSATSPRRRIRCAA